MTYEQIEKEFDEKFDFQCVYTEKTPTKENIKSFLKQSFIKYLKDECERLEKSKLDMNRMNRRGAHILGEDYNQAISDQITHLQAQIKEFEI